MTRDPMSPPAQPEHALSAHGGFVRNLARALLSDAHLAEDVAQEAWLRWHTRGAGAANPRAWLARVVRNLSANATRERGRRAAREEAAARPEPLRVGDEEAAEAETLRTLVEAVLALEPLLRDTLIGRYFRGLDARTLARESGTPEPTVRDRERRALAELRRRLDGRFGDRRAWGLALAGFARPTPSSLPPLVQSGLATAALLAAGMLVLSAWRPGGSSPSPQAAEPVRSARVEPEVLTVRAEPAGADPGGSAVASARAPAASGEASETSEPSAVQVGFATLRGRFVTSSGDAVAGIPCRLGLGGSMIGTGQPYELSPPEDWQDQELLSDPQGRFEVHFAPVKGFSVGFSMRAPGWCKVYIDADDLEAGEVRELGDVVLYRPGRLEGRVLAEDGRPLTGLAWRLSSTAPAPLQGSGLYRGFFSARAEPLDARFVLDGLFPGRSLVVLRADTSDRETFEIELEEGATLTRDLIYHGSDPWRRLVVAPRVVRSFVIRPELRSFRLLAADGRALPAAPTTVGPFDLVFEVLEPGEYTFECEDPRFDPVRIEGVRPGQIFAPVLRGNCGLVLAVRDAHTGVELEPDWMGVELADPSTAPRGFQPELPLVAGRIENLIAGDYLVRARCGERQGEVRIEALVPGETRHVTLDMGDPLSVSGRALDPAGQAVADLELLVLRPAVENDSEGSPILRAGNQASPDEIFRRELARVRTDAEGRFEFSLPRPEVVLLRATDGVNGLPSDQRLVPISGQSSYEVLLTVERLGRIEGRVVPPSGASTEGLELYLSSPGEWGQREATHPLDSEGRFALARIAPGSYRAFLIPAPFECVRSVGGAVLHVRESLYDLFSDGRIANGAFLGEFTVAPGALAQPVFSPAPAAWPGTLELEFLVDGQPARGFTVRLHGEVNSSELATDERGLLGPLRVFGGTWGVTIEDTLRGWTHTFPESLTPRAGQLNRFVLTAERSP